MNSFFLCIAFNFLIVKNQVYLNEDSLNTLCKNSEYLIQESSKHNIDPFVVVALIYNESGWRKKISNSAGACGLTQVLHKYLKGVSCKALYDPKLSIHHGIRILSIYKKHLKSKKNNKNIKNVLQCYASGYKCKCKRCKAYAYRIMRLAKSLKQQYRIIEKVYNEQDTRRPVRNKRRLATSL